MLPLKPRPKPEKIEATMPTHYFYGTILTAEAVASNNRGDNIGNTTTLQKVFVGDDLHTSVSAEAIRFALRYRFQLQGEPVDRSFNVETGATRYRKDGNVPSWDRDEPYIDDDLMGFMDAKAAQQEQESEGSTDEAEFPESDTKTESRSESESGGKKTAKPGKKGKKPGSTAKRTSPLAVGRAISLRPYRGEISFNTTSREKVKGGLSLYAAEMHTTEYQYSFGLNLGDVVAKANIRHLIDAIVDPPQVAGNHSRFAYDFSPASVIFRITSCHSSRIQNCFDHDEETRGYSIGRLIHRIEAGDLPASELIAGGLLAKTEWGAKLKSLGVSVRDGVLASATEAKARIARLGGDFAAVEGKGGAG
jgi:CRISPR-associated protein Cst2